MHSLVDGRLEDRDRIEVAVAFVKVEAEADDELVRNLIAGVLHINVHFSAGRLAQQSEDLHGSGTTTFQFCDQPRERAS